MERFFFSSQRIPADASAEKNSPILSDRDEIGPVVLYVVCCRRRTNLVVGSPRVCAFDLNNSKRYAIHDAALFMSRIINYFFPLNINCRARIKLESAKKGASSITRNKNLKPRRLEY